MGSLKDFYKRMGIRIEKTKTKGFEDDFRLAHEDEDEEIEPDPQRGRHLQNLYTAFKARFEKNKFRVRSKSPSIIKIFNKAAGRLNGHERITHEEIDDRLFVLAQFRKYGRSTYPGHLLSRAAIEFYHKTLDELIYHVATPNKNSERKMLKRLCEARGETEAEVIDAVENSGLLSNAFIKEWKASRKRKI